MLNLIVFIKMCCAFTSCIVHYKFKVTEYLLPSMLYITHYMQCCAFTSSSLCVSAHGRPLVGDGRCLGSGRPCNPCRAPYAVLGEESVLFNIELHACGVCKDIMQQ